MDFSRISGPVVDGVCEKGWCVMRWERLFEDLEARLDSDSRLERELEVADRTRRERALIALHGRLLANVGQTDVAVRLAGGATALTTVGTITDVGPDWILLAEPPRQSVLASLAAVRGVVGLRPGAQEAGLVGRRFTLGAALRGISRDRAGVHVSDVDGRVLTGTIDAVGSDHIDLAEHALDEPRRGRHVVRTHVIPFSAISSIRRR
jgi:hypothetical protein